MKLYLDHLGVLAEVKPGPAGSRHSIPWDQGTFLRFLGILIRAAIMPTPNLECHWRWPKGLPNLAGIESAKQWMSEVAWMRYWRFACIPGIIGGLQDTAELDKEGRTEEYTALKELLDACVSTW